MARRPLVDQRLKLSESVLRSRMIRLGQAVSGRLQTRRPYAFKETHQRSVSTWTVQPGPETQEVRTGAGRSNEHAMVMALENGSNAFVGYSEEWEIAGQQRIFKESRLRFYWSVSDEILPGPPQFRLEWANRDERNEFPGAGAGHPHWQFSEPDIVPEEADTIAFELERSEVDDTDLLLEGFRPVPRLRHLPGRFHFPARACWEKAEWNPEDDPQGTELHAFHPTTAEHLDNWLLSAIRYVKSEMTKYGFG